MSVIEVRLSYEAAISCKQCGSCKRVLENNEPVWRMRINHRPAMFGWTYDTLACCEACATTHDWRVFEDPASCEHCARTVHNEWRQIDRKHVYCCTTCEQKAQIKIAKQKRIDARGIRQCVECSQAFIPARSDALFCCSPCRQMSYRKRVTDNKRVA